MAKYVVAIDQGTTSSRAILFDYDQNMVSVAQKEFTQIYPQFTTPEVTEKPIIFEVFTDVENENEALKRMWNIEKGKSNIVKNVIKQTFGESNIRTIKNLLNK